MSMRSNPWLAKPFVILPEIHEYIFTYFTGLWKTTVFFFFFLIDFPEEYWFMEKKKKMNPEYFFFFFFSLCCYNNITKYLLSIFSIPNRY